MNDMKELKDKELFNATKEISSELLRRARGKVLNSGEALDNRTIQKAAAAYVLGVFIQAVIEATSFDLVEELLQKIGEREYLDAMREAQVNLPRTREN